MWLCITYNWLNDKYLRAFCSFFKESFLFPFPMLFTLHHSESGCVKGCILPLNIIQQALWANKMRYTNFLSWLAPWVGKMERCCLLENLQFVKSPSKVHKSFLCKIVWVTSLSGWNFIDQASSIKMVGHNPHSLFAFLWTLTSSQFWKTQKENLAKIESS